MGSSRFWLKVSDEITHLCDLVHDVDAIFRHPGLTANRIWKSFLKYMIDISYFRKDFQMLLAGNIGHV